MSERAWTRDAPDAVRSLIARALVPDPRESPARIGALTLWPHQRDAVVRLRGAIAEYGGALLADDVGLGKTYVALAIAARYARPLVVAPAALRARWREAAERAVSRCDFVSIESLGRGRVPPRGDLLIVDEAHHARNPATKRYAALAALASGSHTLLLTATPLHNRRADLVALLALFLGARAATLDDATLARCVVRRSRDAVGGEGRPRIDGPHSLFPTSGDDAVPEAILALPPALPAADAGSAHALLLVTMIRQWSSSALALRRGIERRLAAARALEGSLLAGRHPTRRELAAWTLGPDAQQLAFPELLAPTVTDERLPSGSLRATVARHAAALRDLARLAARGDDPDRRRAECLLDAWQGSRGDRLLAFAQLADTVDAYWRALRGVAGVCALSARGGRIASGSIGRDEALAAFAPGARAAGTCRIDALLATDLASEGLDLQGASLLVHLDLPWTPARLEQRLGRVVRPGSPHEAVRVYVMEPPARAATLVAIRERLAAKLAAARLALGPVMPGVLAVADAMIGGAAPPVLAEAVQCRLRRWAASVDDPGTTHDDGAARVAVVRSATGGDGWVALYDGDPPFLAAALGESSGAGPALVAAALDAAEGPPVEGDDAAIVRAVAEALAWRDARWAATLAGVPELGSWRARRDALASAAALAAAPRSRRAGASTIAARARAIATAPLGAGAEQALAAAARGRADPRLWLDAVGALVDDRRHPHRMAAAPPPLRALVVLAPDP